MGKQVASAAVLPTSRLILVLEGRSPSLSPSLLPCSCASWPFVFIRRKLLLPFSMMFNHSAATKVLSHKQTRRNPNHLAQKEHKKKGQAERVRSRVSEEKKKGKKEQAAIIICLTMGLWGTGGIRGQVESNRITSKGRQTKTEFSFPSPFSMDFL